MAKVKFDPQYPEKYAGMYPIVAKSSWELEFMNYCDQHPDVLEWSYEPVKIPYSDPTKTKTSQSIYIPDFLVTFIRKGGGNSTKLIEVKPLHEADQGFARSNRDAMIKMKNDAKWAAAQAWAMRRGVDFMVMTEADMFSGHENRQPRQNPVRPAVPAQVKNNKASKQKHAPKLAKGFKSTKARRVSPLSKSTAGKVRKSSRVSKVRKA